MISSLNDQAVWGWGSCLFLWTSVCQV